MKSNQFWTAAGRMLAVATVALIVVLVLVPGAWAANYRVIHKFNGAGGSDPIETVFVFDTAGNLYGTTLDGGVYGYGTVFELTPNSDGSWTENVLYSFTGGSDGGRPQVGVMFDAGGNLYGATFSDGEYGDGTVYKLTPNSDGSWSESVLYAFTGRPDGRWPLNLTLDAAGALYGTTVVGGAHNVGAVFKLTPNSDGTWTESIVYSFKNRDDGNPEGRLLFDTSGNLYGTTSGRNRHSGVVYELIPQQDGSWQFEVLHRFNWNDRAGFAPASAVFDQAGSLYAATYGGGGKGCSELHGCGTVFELTSDSNGKWKEQVLYRFKGGRDAAEAYNAGVVFDTAGNLYGTTLHGGGGSCRSLPNAPGSGCGTVFKLTPNGDGGWTEQVVHRFRGPAGGNPYTGLVMYGGKIYGTASGQGTSGSNGCVYEITP